MTLWAATVATLTLTSALALPTQEHWRIEGTYVNPDYGYTVTIPDGLHGDNLAPPAPQHGFGIDLNTKSEDSIWVDASYDSIFLGSATAEANRQAADFRREHKLVVTKSAMTKISGLEARDVVLENRQQTEAINYIHFVVVFRRQPGGVGTVYTIGLQQKVRTAAGEKAFSQVLKSFRATLISN